MLDDEKGHTNPTRFFLNKRSKQDIIIKLINQMYCGLSLLKLGIYY